jgi:hypothetical protein
MDPVIKKAFEQLEKLSKERADAARRRAEHANDFLKKMTALRRSKRSR